MNQIMAYLTSVKIRMFWTNNNDVASDYLRNNLIPAQDFECNIYIHQWRKTLSLDIQTFLGPNLTFYISTKHITM